MQRALAAPQAIRPRLAASIILVFILGLLAPLAPSPMDSVEPLELDPAEEFMAEARSSSSWSMMSGGSANGNGRYIGVNAASGLVVAGGQMDGGQATLSWDGVSTTSGDVVSFWLAGIESDGSSNWVSMVSSTGPSSPAMNPGDLDVADSGDTYVTGSFRGTATFGSHSLTSTGLYDCFIAKMNSDGVWQWAESLKGAGDIQDGGSTTLDVVWGTAITPVPGGVVVGGFYLGSTDVGNNAGTSISDADIFMASFDDFGQSRWLADATGPEVNEVHSITADMGGEVWIATSFEDSMSFGSHSVQGTGGGNPVIASINSNGAWTAAHAGSTTGSTFTTGIDLDQNGDPVLAGTFSGTVSFGSHSKTSVGQDDGFITTYRSGSWSYLTHVGSSSYEFLSDLVIDPSSGNALVSIASAGSLSIAGQQFSSQGENDSVIASLDPSGQWSRMVSAHGGADNWPGALAIDHSGNVSVLGTSSGNIDFSSTNAGTASPSASFGPYLWKIPGFGNADSDGDDIFDEDDNCPNVHNSGQEDHDSDGMGDACDSDDDDDGILDNNGDDCPLGELGWTSTSIESDPNSSTDWDIDGCMDGSSEDDDSDNDQKTDDVDLCPRSTWDRTVSIRPEWISEPDSDQDQDGCRDADEDSDDDNDGLLDGNDNCPDDAGTSNKGTVLGCPDRDGDGWADQVDDCPDISGNSENGSLIGCLDTDGDGWADEIDDLPFEPTQWIDSDGDNYGDNTDGNNADDCPDEAGASSEDRQGCKDSDSDGYSNPDDQWFISDGADALPSDPTQWTDFDGDGFGDNYGNTSWTTTRNENWPGEYVLLAFNQDACPLEYGTSTEGEVAGCSDRDGDGWADIIDAFPDDGNEYLDSDRDGVADGQDSCRTTNGGSQYDRKGCPDIDGDGWSDPDALWTVGNGADAFRDEPSQWADADGDGFGDNQAGINADDCPDVFGTNDADGQRGCPETAGDGTEDGSLSEDTSSGIAGGLVNGEMVTWGLIGGGVIAVIILLLVLVRGGSEDEEFAEDEDELYHQQYAQAMAGNQQYTAHTQAHQQTQYQTVQQQAAVAHHPDPSVVGQMRTDGNEWVEYPHSSGVWYSRDAATRQWIRRI